MPIALREHQHELTTEDGSLSLVFGTSDTSYLTLKPPSIGSVDARTGDVERQREDGIAFGEDFEGGKTVTFEVGVLTDRADDPHRSNADALGSFEAVWKARRLRDRSDKYAILRSVVGGRLVRCYGRPRRYEETAGRLMLSGYTPILADFVVSDGRWYDDFEQSVDARLIPASDGGLIAPLVTPLTTTAASVKQSALTVAGSEDTWPVVTFHGPVDRPRLDFGAFAIGLDGNIAAGRSVTVDPRPWVRSALRDDGANYAGMLSWETPPMRKMLLGPGTHVLTYRGTDATNTSQAVVTWRNAYPRP